MKKAFCLIFYLTVASRVNESGADLPSAVDICKECLDFSRIGWAHGVNSRQMLDFYLNDPSTLMIEADILIGHLKGMSNSSEPIMAHPPNVTSDLSLEAFIDILIEFNNEGATKGAKLDFKQIEALEEAAKSLEPKAPMISFPLWLNADIQNGPLGKAEYVVDAQRFLTVSKTLFPDATLSVGWTTGYSANKSDGYTREMLDDMIEILKLYKITQPVTFPIRASYVRSSAEIQNLMHLINSVPGSTFTIWTSSSDVVDLDALFELQKSAGYAKVYFDLQKSQIKMFNIIRAMDRSC